MTRRIALVLAIPLALAGALFAATPALATPINWLPVTTVEAIIQPSGDSIMGTDSVAYVSAGGGSTVNPVLGSTNAAGTLYTLFEGSTFLASCTIPAASLTCASVPALPALAPGLHNVKSTFQTGPSSIDINGTLFAVTDVAPTVTIQWQDASGAWVDDTSSVIPLFNGTTALQCTITNNSNAPIVLDNFTGAVNGPPVTLTGTFQPGETKTFPVWTGPVSDASGGGGGCGGSVDLADGTLTGNGNGGSVILIDGTIAIAPAPRAGVTATVTGTGITPVVTTLPVFLDGVEVAGSPATISGPGNDFSIPVVLPANLAPGVHTIAVHATFVGQDVVYAQFTFEVTAALAATGVDVVTPGILALLVLLAGAGFLIVSRRRARVYATASRSSASRIV